MEQHLILKQLLKDLWFKIYDNNKNSKVLDIISKLHKEIKESKNV